MKRVYFVCASRCGAFGAPASLVRLPERYTTRRAADAARARLARNPAPRTVYFTEWESKR